MNLEFRLTVQDYLAAQRLHFRPKPIWRAVLWVVVGFCVASLLQEVWIIAHRGVLPHGWWILPAGLAYGALLFFIFLPWKVGKIFRDNPRLSEPMRIELAEDGLLLQTSRGQVRAPWTMLKSWKRNRALVLIYHSRVHFHILPRRAFANAEEYERAAALLTQHLGHEKN